MKLKDKVAVITGSASGIARAIAMEYLKEGAKIVFVDNDKTALAQIPKELKVGEDRYILCATDLTQKKEIDVMVNETLKNFDTVDILVNHVGDAYLKPFSVVTDEDFDFAVDLTLRTTFVCTKAILPIMMKKSYGKIINTASVAGKIGMPNSSFMCMAKHGIIGLTKALALEYGRHNINVNAVCPALIETNTTKKRMVPNFDSIKKIIVNNSALGRLTTPEEIARLYVFLASDDASFMTGQAVNWTGGFLMI